MCHRRLWPHFAECLIGQLSDRSTSDERHSHQGGVRVRGDGGQSIALDQPLLQCHGQHVVQRQGTGGTLVGDHAQSLCLGSLVQVGRAASEAHQLGGAGILAQGGALGVGNATRSAVRDSIILVIVLNYFMTWFFYQQ